jgi:hypothetical protein
MPIYVTVYHLDKMIVGKTEGEVTLADLEGYFAAITKARAVAYCKIFDATRGTSILSPEEAGVFRDLIVGLVERNRGKIGPLAVVTGDQRLNRLANICRAVTDADADANRPMKVFNDIRAARAWLLEKMPGT